MTETPAGRDPGLQIATASREPSGAREASAFGVVAGCRAVVGHARTPVAARTSAVALCGRPAPSECAGRRHERTRDQALYLSLTVMVAPPPRAGRDARGVVDVDPRPVELVAGHAGALGAEDAVAQGDHACR